MVWWFGSGLDTFAPRRTLCISVLICVLMCACTLCISVLICVLMCACMCLCMRVWVCMCDPQDCGLGAHANRGSCPPYPQSRVPAFCKKFIKASCVSSLTPRSLPLADENLPVIRKSRKATLGSLSWARTAATRFKSISKSVAYSSKWMAHIWDWLRKCCCRFYTRAPTRKASASAFQIDRVVVADWDNWASEDFK